MREVIKIPIKIPSALNKPSVITVVGPKLGNAVIDKAIAACKPP